MAKPLFEIGQVVTFIDEIGSAEVLDILESGNIKVLTDEGFEMEYPVSKLVPRYDLQQVEEEPEVVKQGPILEMKGLKLGDKVSLRGTELDAVIMSFEEDGKVLLEMEGLFTEKHHIDDLITWDAEKQKKLIDSLEGVDLESIGEAGQKEKGNQSVNTRRDSGAWEVDLHIQELVDNSYGMMKHEIIQIQLDHFTGKLEQAIHQGLKKIIFIHGRGEGRLKGAIKQVLERYPNCESLDADYQRYGVGATEVRIHYRMRDLFDDDL